MGRSGDLGVKALTMNENITSSLTVVACHFHFCPFQIHLSTVNSVIEEMRKSSKILKREKFVYLKQKVQENSFYFTYFMYGDACHLSVRWIKEVLLKEDYGKYLIRIIVLVLGNI